MSEQTAVANPERLRIEQGMQRLEDLSRFGQTPEGAGFSHLAAELEAVRADPDALTSLEGAMDSWASTPYVDGTRGEDGLGTNGGVEHFFAYRGDELKSKRWDNPGLNEFPPTIAGFVELSKTLSAAANTPEASADTKMAYDIADTEGNVRRIGNFRGNNQYVSFKTANSDRFLISSVYPIKDISMLRPKAEKEAAKWSPEKEASYINQLKSAPTLTRSR